MRRRVDPGLLRIASIIALLGVFALRAGGPSDLWDQTQPKSITYTTSLVAADVPPEASWILPLGPGGERATKPPLYNWLAAPAVALLGTDSEPAHKLPSVVALGLLWLLVIRVGRRMGTEATGWLAGLVLLACYPMFKLGYLARPDMVLAALLGLGWYAATQVLLAADGAAVRGWALAFWASFAAALLAKGPAAVVLPIFAVVAARPIGGSAAGVGRFGWAWGLSLALLPFALWLMAAWRLDARHVVDVLWGEEIWGRLSGTGPEGGGGGWKRIAIELPLMTVYAVIRSLPWSIVTLVGAWCVLRRVGLAKVPSPGRSIAASALLWVALVIGLFSLSAGKRADYVASVYAPAALVAAWALTFASPEAIPLLVGRTWTAVATGLTAIALMGAVASREPAAPRPGFGDELLAFAQQVRAQIDADPAPLRTCWTGTSPLKGLVGHLQPDDRPAITQAMRSGESFWVLAGRRWRDELDLDAWHERTGRPHRLRLVARSTLISRADGWPGRVSLYRVD